MGFTGNVLGGDERAPEDMVGLEVRYIDGRGRSNSFTNSADFEWDADDNTSFKDGVTTFAHLPAAAKIIVTADESADNIKLLDDEISVYDKPGYDDTGRLWRPGRLQPHCGNAARCRRPAHRITASARRSPT